MNEPLHIEISLSKPGEWRVVERSRLAAENLSRIAFKESELADILEETNQCLRDANLNANLNVEAQRTRLHRLGGRLAELALPGTLRERIATASSPVEFFLDDASILLPVELFPNGDTVLAEALPVTRHWFCENAATPVRKSLDKGKQALIVADPAADLPGALLEGGELYRKFRTQGKNWHCRYLGRPIPGTELAKELPDTDLLHLAAHYVTGDDESSSGIVMTDGLWMPSLSSHTPELVFANCCRAGVPSTDNGNLSLAGRFLQRGTRHVIAPFLPASDDVAKLFANAFYQALFSGKDVATSVWEARKVIGPASWIYWYFGAFTAPPIMRRSIVQKIRQSRGLLSAGLLATLFILSGIALYFRNTATSGTETSEIQGKEELLSKSKHLENLTRRLDEMELLGAKAPGIMTPYMEPAAETGDIPAIELILRYGWPINGMDYKGNSPMRYALFAGQLEAMDWLWRNGADVEKVDRFGTIPMHVAAQLGRVDIMQWLHDKGAKIDAATQSGQTALSIAKKQRNAKVIDWLEKHGK